MSLTLLVFGSPFPFASYPLDGVDNVLASWSVRRLKSNYNGSLFQLRRSSDNEVRDFSEDEIPLISNWLNGANGFFVKFYSQTGGAILEQSTLNAQPTLELNPICAVFNGTDQYMISANASLNNIREMSFFWAVKWGEDTGDTNRGVVSKGLPGATGWRVLLNGFLDNVDYSYGFSSSRGRWLPSNNSLIFDTYKNYSIQYSSLISSPPNIKINNNNSSQMLTVLNTPAGSVGDDKSEVFTLFADSSGTSGFVPCIFYEFILVGSLLEFETESLIRNNQYSVFSNF